MPTLVITKYMGSKKAILDFVGAELSRLTEPGEILVDLMAGTHTIGYAMKQRCRMVTNDIQRFSLVIGHTLLNYSPRPRFEGAAWEAFRRYYQFNFRHLESLFEPALRMERAMLGAGQELSPGWEAYREFCEGYPFYRRPEPSPGWPEEFLLLFKRQRLEAYQALNKLEPYSLFSLYYGNSYLGVRQAAEVDSLRYAIDKLCDEWIPEHPDGGFDPLGLRCLLLSALIALLSRVNPGPGHWAAFPHVSAANHGWLVSQRSIAIHHLFPGRVAELEAALARHESPYAPHIVMTEDYVTFMREVQEYIKRARVLYLDPPYSQGHYSRFYHLIETLVRYDYPDIGHVGRYRSDRHQSPFSHKDKVATSLGKVCQAALDAGTTLVISYSRGGVIPDVEAFMAILKGYYPDGNIRFQRLSSEHSKLGQAERLRTEEYLFTCKP